MQRPVRKNPVRFYTGMVHRSQAANRGRGKRRGDNKGIQMAVNPGLPPQPPKYGQVRMGKRDQVQHHVANNNRRLGTSTHWGTANTTCSNRRRCIRNAQKTYRRLFQRSAARICQRSATTATSTASSYCWINTRRRTRARVRRTRGCCTH